jgi:hypothetical protein
MHWNYPDFKEICTTHFSNLAYMLRMYGVAIISRIACGIPNLIKKKKKKKCILYDVNN